MNKHIKSLYVLHEDCKKAASNCPQFDNNMHHFDTGILLGRVSDDEVMTYWANNKILWDYGYHIYLEASIKSKLLDYKVKLMLNTYK